MCIRDSLKIVAYLSLRNYTAGGGADDFDQTVKCVTVCPSLLARQQQRFPWIKLLDWIFVKILERERERRKHGEELGKFAVEWLQGGGRDLFSPSSPVIMITIFSMCHQG